MAAEEFRDTARQQQQQQQHLAITNAHSRWQPSAAITSVVFDLQC
jgi:hypothetical protein